MARLYQYVQWHLSEVKPISDHLQNHLIQNGKICRIMAHGRGATPTECQRAAPPQPPSCSSVGGCSVAPRAVSKEDDRKAPILWLSCHFWSERRHSSCSCNHFAVARHLPMPLVVDVTPAANTREACQHHYCTSESLAPNNKQASRMRASKHITQLRERRRRLSETNA